MRFHPLPAVLACALLASAATASEFDDFRIPDHHWRHVAFSFEGRLNGQDFGDADLESRDVSRFGNLAGSLDWYRDSESRQHRFTLSGQVAGQGASSDRALLTDLSDVVTGQWTRYENVERDHRIAAESANLAADWREYPWTAPWGIHATLDAAGTWQQDWSVMDSDLQDVVGGVVYRTLQQADGELRTYGFRVQGSLGAGYGRVRDATGVERTRLLLDRLRADGRLVRAPSPEAARKLASLFYVEPAFAAPHDFPGRFFWREVERILREDGAVGEAGLDAFEVLHALEPLVVAGGRFYRPAGWFAGPLASFRHVHQGGHGEFHRDTRYFIDDSLVSEDASGFGSSFGVDGDVVLAGGVVEYHRAFGPRMQVDLASIAEVELGDEDPESTWQTGAQAGYLVDERWFAWIKGNHGRTLAEGGSGLDRWTATAGAGLRYYLEDQWSVAFEYVHQQTGTNDYGPDGDRFSRNQALLLGVRWERGAADAPGLVDPVRPLP